MDSKFQKKCMDTEFLLDTLQQHLSVYAVLELSDEYKHPLS